MSYLVRCECGMEMRDEHQDRLIETVQEHALIHHDLDFSAQQVRELIEVEETLIETRA